MSLLTLVYMPLAAHPAQLVIPEPSELAALCDTALGWRPDNKRAYTLIDRAHFEDIAEKRGLIAPKVDGRRSLDGHRDLLVPDVMEVLGLGSSPPPDEVLEIGGGYGRVVEFLRTKTDIRKIYVVEVSDLQALWLSQQYGNQSDVAQFRRRLGRRNQEIEVWHQNIADPERFTTSVIKAKVGLWMFAGRLELSPPEGILASENLYTATPEGFQLIVDIPLGPVVPSLRSARLVRNRLDLLFDDSMDPPTVHLYPVIPATLEVDQELLKWFFLRRSDHYEKVLWALEKEVEYDVGRQFTPPRRKLFFFRSTK